MITCPHCAALNMDDDEFCSECFKMLSSDTGIQNPMNTATTSAQTGIAATVSATSSQSHINTSLSPPDFRVQNDSETEAQKKQEDEQFANMMRQLQNKGRELEKKRQADILFVFDCTGSMQPQIDGMKETIIQFAESIRSEGVRARVGLIEYRDRLINEEHIVHRFNGSIFTDDPAAFKNVVSKLKARGGGANDGESAYDALIEATRQPFNSEGQHVIVLITDEPPHEVDREVKSIETLIQAFRNLPVNQFYPVIDTSDHRAQQTYLKLYESGCRGSAFDLGRGNDFSGRAEHFKRTLMQLGKTISTATR